MVLWAHEIPDPHQRCYKTKNLTTITKQKMDLPSSNDVKPPPPPEAEWCNLDSTGSSFLLPEGWPTMEFFVDSRSKGPANSASKILNDWENRVFCIEGRGGRVGSCVLLNKQHILTAAHLSFKLGECYPIKGPGLEGSLDLRVRCDFISNHFDFAVLSSDALQDLELSTDALKRGSKYFIMGYPNGVEASRPTITKGIIKEWMVDGIHLVGTPGSKRGCAGAPVFDDTRRLAGILMGSATARLDQLKMKAILVVFILIQVSLALECVLNAGTSPKLPSPPPILKCDCGNYCSKFQYEGDYLWGCGCMINSNTGKVINACTHNGLNDGINCCSGNLCNNKDQTSSNENLLIKTLAKATKNLMK
ncbi:unnamed protein product, partial [Mesorhabditis belari]|uniref:Uncharacterized protein n=1 Tax=Mesorhabditis belari TaxID=2138241 RepID=A0AAF3F5A5_9BILA